MSKTEMATFGGGCFWGVEEVFRTLDGVVSTAVGYAGGTVPDPTYDLVCTGNTGHAEVVQITFDPDRCSYERLVELFFASHKPTELNRQGPDIGTQYRSVIFTHSDEQQRIAGEIKDAVQTSGRYDKPVITEISPFTDFHRAEEYHQQYIAKGGRAACNR